MRYKIIITAFSFLIFLQSHIVNAQASATAALKNPLGGIPNVETLFQSIMIAFITISVPIIVFFVIYAGFLYVTAQGNPEKIKAASKALLYAIIGGVIIIGAIAITTIVGNTVNSFK